MVERDITKTTTSGKLPFFRQDLDTELWGPVPSDPKCPGPGRRFIAPGNHQETKPQSQLVLGFLVLDSSRLRLHLQWIAVTLLSPSGLPGDLMWLRHPSRNTTTPSCADNLPSSNHLVLPPRRQKSRTRWKWTAAPPGNRCPVHLPPSPPCPPSSHHRTWLLISAIVNPPEENMSHQSWGSSTKIIKSQTSQTPT